MECEIRPVAPPEFAAAGAVAATAFRTLLAAHPEAGGEHQWERYLRELANVADRATRTTVLVALDRSQILGTVTVEIDGRVDPDQEPPAPDTIHIRMLAVLPEAQGRGLGRALMEAGFALARERGRIRVTLSTGTLMVAARTMYESMGFRQVSDQPMATGGHLYGYALDLDAATALPSPP